LTEAQDRRYQFGLFDLDALTGDLYKDGLTHSRLQGQPLEILLLLLKRPGELVTREELRSKLWSSDTFVDYDHSLNAAVNKLREALGDSAESPRFIQTLPRRGYRFIAPVQPPVEQMKSSRTEAEPEWRKNPSDRTAARTSLLSHTSELPPVPSETARVLFCLIQLLYLGFYISALVDLRRTENMLMSAFGPSRWVFTVLVVTALVGIPMRLYLLSASLFRYHGLAARFRSLFIPIFALDELWALAPLVIAEWIGAGLALAAAAALVYLPFSQRSLLLMPERTTRSRPPTES
jgi:cholera toxin transcriptional activator